MSEVPTLRVLVVDDSPYNRGVLTNVLEGIEGVCVVGRAKDGREALALCAQLTPDLVTLDLEMPEMDGFMFLRLMTRRHTTPVLVVSGYSSRENVFRALELGAMDFIGTPSDSIAPDLRVIAAELTEKVGVIQRIARTKQLRRTVDVVQPPPRPRKKARSGGSDRPAVALIAIASSTGGPLALQTVLSRLDPSLPIAVVIAQHMPAQYTETFAARMDRQFAMRVKQAQCGDLLAAGRVYLAPGGRHLLVHESEQGPSLELLPAEDSSVRAAHICPNGDHLLSSAARVFRDRCCGVVLTGMGDDGTRGCQRIKSYGGWVIAQDPESAIVSGMPGSVISAGVADEVVALPDIHGQIEAYVARLGASLRIGGT